MAKTGIDQDAMIEMFAQASAKQGETLRQAVSDATLKALQGREMTVKNIRSTLKTVTQAASAGAMQGGGNTDQVETLLAQAFEGMDAALLQAVEANRRALQQFVTQGAALQQKPFQDAFEQLEKMEDLFFKTVSKAAESAGAPLQGPWSQVLDTMRVKGTGTGVQATAAIEQLMAQTQAAMRQGRASTLRASQAMMDSYAALVSGVLIGMAEGLQQGGSQPDAGAAKKRSR